MNIIEVEGSKVPILSWCPNLEESALEQMKVISRLPFVTHCAIMPDGHLGQNMCIGGVVACRDVIVPDFVGSDCGCGVIAIQSSLNKSDLLDIELRKRIHASVCRSIPMGFNHNSQNRISELNKTYSAEIKALFDKSGILTGKDILGDSKTAVLGSLSTLGGGNHYASTDYDENDNVWIMVHSGSRRLGMQINEYFNELASSLNKKWHSVDTEGIPFLPTDTEEGTSYLRWMDFALRFAFLNRQIMINEMIKDITHIIPRATFNLESLVNIHHNYASLEFHLGKNVWVHRKGAVEARKGTKGIIPGSMGTASYLTEGLGNPLSLHSSSHGAGRTKGRKAFNVEMNTPDGLEKIKKSMEGIVYTDFGKAGRGRDAGMTDVSEAPAAYKDIEEVMNNQSDLVKPIHKLMTMINWKDSGKD